MGLPIVTVTQNERATGMPGRDSTLGVYDGLHKQGVVILRGLFAREMIASLHDEFVSRLGTLDSAVMRAMSERPAPNRIQKNGDGRFEIVMRMNGGFGQAGLFANPVLMTLLRPMLGEDFMRLASMTAVASFPGAQQQHSHHDYPPLFADFPRIGPALPSYAITAAIPLIDVDHTIGPTGFWPGSHRWEHLKSEPMQSAPFERGDCILVDYRTIHAGMANNSQTVRPILYMVYCREWFYDDSNNRQRNPLDITLEEIQALPEDMQILMLRAQQQAIRAQRFAMP
jgi:Phytanoyl-CoA dioxygenase (PhyH)